MKARSVHKLLANSQSLERFSVWNAPYTFSRSPSTQDALSIAAGLSKSSSIKNVELQDVQGSLWDIIFLGLFTSAVKVLSLESNRDFDKEEQGHYYMDYDSPALSKLLRIPSLKKLYIGHFSDEPDPRMIVGNILTDLRRYPDQAIGVKTLGLTCVLLSSGTEIETICSEPDTVPIEQCNAGIEDLYLENIKLQTAKEVCLFWNLVGLGTLNIDRLVFLPSFLAESTRCHRAYWAELIRRNGDLAELMLSVYPDGDEDEDEYHPHYIALFSGLLEGSCMHRSLTYIKIECCYTPGIFNGEVGLQLYQVLIETKSLKELEIGGQLEQWFIQLLVVGLCHNKSLESLSFLQCVIDSVSMTKILQSLLRNGTLKVLNFDSLLKVRGVDFSIHGDFGPALFQVFEGNKTLVELSLPKIDLRQGRLSVSLAGLEGNTTLKALDLQTCRVDNEGMASLAQTLESPNSGALEEIGLPYVYLHEDDDIQEGRRAFLGSLAKMPKVKRIYYGCKLAELDTESLGLVRHAVERNKSLVFFGDLAGKERSQTCNGGPSVVKEIEYDLKLNRYGRRILDSPNVAPSLWPRILCPMADKPEDVDACFFFVRQFFSRQNKQDHETAKSD